MFSPPSVSCHGSLPWVTRLSGPIGYDNIILRAHDDDGSIVTPDGGRVFTADGVPYHRISSAAVGVDECGRPVCSPTGKYVIRGHLLANMGPIVGPAPNPGTETHSSTVIPKLVYEHCLLGGRTWIDADSALVVPDGPGIVEVWAPSAVPAVGPAWEELPRPDTELGNGERVTLAVSACPLLCCPGPMGQLSMTIAEDVGVNQPVGAPTPPVPETVFVTRPRRARAYKVRTGWANLMATSPTTRVDFYSGDVSLNQHIGTEGWLLSSPGSWSPLLGAASLLAVATLGTVGTNELVIDVYMTFEIGE